VRNPAAPDIWDANHVDTVTASRPDDIRALLERAAAEYAHTTTLRFDLDARTPPEFEAQLLLEGFAAVPALVSILEGALVGTARQFEIVPVGDAGSWDAFFALKALDWAEGRVRLGQAPQSEVGQSMAIRNMAKAPPVRFWLGYIDGVARGFLSSWEGIAGVGQVEDLFVQEEFRRRGLASALLHHCVADCRAHGAGPVVIVSDPTDTPKHMYAAMGWRPIAVKHEYRRTKS